MVSPLARQRQQIINQQVQEKANVTTVANPNSLHLLLAELETDEKVLKGLNRIDEKVAHKRDVLVPKYRDAIEAYLDGEDTFDNPLLAKMVIWLFDIGDLETAIKWCDIAIERELDTPERFKRDFATFCADEVLAWSEKMAAQGHSVEPYFTTVFNKVRNEWRIHEKPTAKWFKFAGLRLLNDDKGKPVASSVGSVETLNEALALLTEANNQYAAIGVTTHIDKIHQRIRALESGNNL